MLRHRQYIFYIFSRATLNETFTAKYYGVLPRTPQVRPKSEIYTFKRDDEHPRPFHMQSPPPPGRKDTEQHPHYDKSKSTIVSATPRNTQNTALSIKVLPRAGGRKYLPLCCWDELVMLLSIWSALLSWGLGPGVPGTVCSAKDK